MEIEKEKRNALLAQRKPNKDGTMWRSATTSKPVAGYTQQVLNHHRQAQPNLPPTSIVTNPGEGKENTTAASAMSM